jgi:hypothetical protein
MNTMYCLRSFSISRGKLGLLPNGICTSTAGAKFHFFTSVPNDVCGTPYNSLAFKITHFTFSYCIDCTDDFYRIPLFAVF